MSKYVIEIKPEYEDKFKGVMILGAENSNLYVDSNTVDELEELNSDYINEHFGDLQDTAYQKGLNDAWECARKIVCDDTCGGMSMKELVEIFNKSSDAYIIRDYTAQQAIEKIKAYEKKQADKIEVGDEVKSLNDSGVEIEGLLPWVVTTVDQGDYCQGIDSKGEVHATKKVRACKTGRHFDIASILEDMRHD